MVDAHEGVGAAATVSGMSTGAGGILVTDLRVVRGAAPSEPREPGWAVHRLGDRTVLHVFGVGQVRLSAANARRLAAALLVASESDYPG